MNGEKRIMGRLTINKKVHDMSMVELAHNSCYAENHKAMYRDFETVRDARNFARDLYEAYANENLPTDDDEFDGRMIDDLQYEPTIHANGLIALFYRNLWAMADLRERLKAYEDIIDNPEKLKIIDGWYSDLCKENWQLNRELAEYKKLEDEGLLLRLPCKEGADIYYILGVPNKTPCVIESCTFELSDIHRIGKTLFLTKEEEEQALEQMKEV